MAAFGTDVLLPSHVQPGQMLVHGQLVGKELVAVMALHPHSRAAVWMGGRKMVLE